MATITKFEDLEIWQMARKFASSIQKLTMEEKFSKEFKFKNQIKSSSVPLWIILLRGLVERVG